MHFARARGEEGMMEGDRGSGWLDGKWGLKVWVMCVTTLHGGTYLAGSLGVDIGHGYGHGHGHGMKGLIERNDIGHLWDCDLKAAAGGLCMCLYTIWSCAAWCSRGGRRGSHNQACGIPGEYLYHRLLLSTLNWALIILVYRPALCWWWSHVIGPLSPSSCTFVFPLPLVKASSSLHRDGSQRCFHP